MSGMPWVKLYVEILDDVKMGRLTDAQKWRFVQLILLAAKCDAGGALVTGDFAMTLDDISYGVRCDVEALERDIEKLVELGLIVVDDDAYVIAKFEERQGPSQETKRAQWRARQRARRERAKKNGRVTGDNSVTPDEVTPLEEEEEVKSEDVESDAPLFRQLSAAFVNHAGLPEFTGGDKKYVKCIKDWIDLGATPQDVEAAVKALRKKKWSISGPWSLTNPIAIEIGERKGASAEIDAIKGQYSHA